MRDLRERDLRDLRDLRELDLRDLRLGASAALLRRFLAPPANPPLADFLDLDLRDLAMTNMSMIYLYAENKN